MHSSANPTELQPACRIDTSADASSPAVPVQRKSAPGTQSELACYAKMALGAVGLLLANYILIQALLHCWDALADRPARHAVISLSLVAISLVCLLLVIACDSVWQPPGKANVRGTLLCVLVWGVCMVSSCATVRLALRLGHWLTSG